MANWLGIDIGGANIKLADANQFARSIFFPLWKTPNRLSNAIADLVGEAGPFDGLAVTMTGELADCYSTREEGVCRILEQLTAVVPAPMVRVYAVGGEWLSVGQAARRPWDVAASNWYALAQFSARYTDHKPAVLLDIGSTTCDVIPIMNGEVHTEARVDSQRLQALQLVYTGVERTPICAVTQQLPLHGSPCPVMSELFATMSDAYLWTGDLPEDAESTETCDGQPKTRSCAAFRLARMVGEDGSSLCDQDIDSIAEAAIDAQAQQLASALDRQRKSFGRAKCDRLVTSGHGDFLVDAVLHRLEWNPQRLSLMQLLGPEISRCGPSHAIAALATEQLSNSAVTT